MQIGIDSFASIASDPVTGVTLRPDEQLRHLLAEIEHADQVGLDVFGIGEHHRIEFLDSAPAILKNSSLGERLRRHEGGVRWPATDKP